MMYYKFHQRVVSKWTIMLCTINCVRFTFIWQVDRVCRRRLLVSCWWDAWAKVTGVGVVFCCVLRISRSFVRNCYTARLRGIHWSLIQYEDVVSIGLRWRRCIWRQCTWWGTQWSPLMRHSWCWCALGCGELVGVWLREMLAWSEGDPRRDRRCAVVRHWRSVATRLMSSMWTNEVQRVRWVLVAKPWSACLGVEWCMNVARSGNDVVNCEAALMRLRNLDTMDI